MHRDPNKIIIPVSEKCKQQPVHVRGKVVCRTYVPSPEVGLAAVIIKQQPTDPKFYSFPDCYALKGISNQVTTTRTKTVYPTLGAMFGQKVESEVAVKKQLTTDQITALALKHITLDRILVEYKHSSIVAQIAQYIIGLNSYNAFNADQQELLCNKVMQIMSENGLAYNCKVVSAGTSSGTGSGTSTKIPIIPASEANNNNNSKATIDEFRSAILASVGQAAWVSLDSVMQIVGNHALGNSDLAHKMAVNKDLIMHNLLIVDSGVATDKTTVIIRVTDTSDTISSIATIVNIKAALVAAGSKKALYFGYNEIAQGLGVNLDSLTTAEADKVIKQYLLRNGVFVVYKGTTVTGESSIRLGFTEPVKAKHKKQMLIEDDSEHKKMMAEVSAIKDAEMEARRKREDDECLKAKHNGQ